MQELGSEVKVQTEKILHWHCALSHTEKGLHKTLNTVLSAVHEGPVQCLLLPGHGSQEDCKQGGKCYR